MAEALRRRRQGKIRRSWYVDETYVKVQGRWCHLYRPIDALVDVRLNETRDIAAAEAFFQDSHRRYTSPGDDGWARQLPKGDRVREGAFRTELGEAVHHRTNQYLKNRIEQDHRDIRGRYQPGSRADRRLRGSVEASTNGFLRPPQIVTNMIPPATPACTPSPARSR